MEKKGGGAPCWWSRYCPAAGGGDHKGADVRTVACGEPTLEISPEGLQPVQTGWSRGERERGGVAERNCNVLNICSPCAAWGWAAEGSLE